MSHLSVMIVRVDDENPEKLTEIWRRSLPQIILEGLAAEKYLDEMEGTVLDVGREMNQNLFLEHWRLTDQAFTTRYHEDHALTDGVTCDGFDNVKVLCRFGVVYLPRQVCKNVKNDQHVLPGNAGLPVHQGQIATRGFQECACLLPQDVPFSTAQRLLGWMTGDPKIVSETQMRRWVAHHGQLIREAEQTEVQELSARKNLDGLSAQLVTVKEVRHPAAWKPAMDEAVKAALDQPNSEPPKGVSHGDWERVLKARSEAQELKKLRRLGPEVRPGEVVASTDDVCVRRPEKRRWLELRTACVRTSRGHRYLSGTPKAVLQQLYLLLQLCGGINAKLTLLGDGARWIFGFFAERLAGWTNSEMILDWYHLGKKCSELASMICCGRMAKKKLLRQLLCLLWRGRGQDALSVLQDYRPQAKNVEMLDALITYLTARLSFLPDYKHRRANRQFIGSGFVEKANDLIVSRRQKNKGMHWSLGVSDGLAALRTLMLNEGWDLYWQENQVLTLAIIRQSKNPIGLAR